MEPAYLDSKMDRVKWARTSIRGTDLLSNNYERTENVCPRQRCPSEGGALLLFWVGNGRSEAGLTGDETVLPSEKNLILGPLPVL